MQTQLEMSRVLVTVIQFCRMSTAGKNYGVFKNIQWRHACKF